MKILKRYRVKILFILNRLIFFRNYSISYYFSRFGNNLQQIAIGILYSKKKNGNFYSLKHQYINKFSTINSPLNNYFSFFKKHYRFFYFHNKKDFPKIDMDDEYIEKNIEHVFKQEIYKNINFLKDTNIDDESLVIHIRSGDIFSLPIKNYYQNPIDFYTQVAKGFKKVIVVTSKDMLNPICSELKKNNNFIFQSTSLENDFNTLYNAKHLATSGVGTFPIAAALLSKKLRNIYYSDLYLKEHLNPKMITNKEVIHHMYKVEENYIKKYEKEENIANLILDESVSVIKLSN